MTRRLSPITALTLLLAGLLVATAAGSAMVGGVAAQTATPTPTPTDSPTATATDSGAALDQTISVDNQTRAVWVEVENASNGADVTVYGISGSDITTEIATTTLTTTDAEPTAFEEWTADSAAYAEYRIVVEGDVDAEAGSVEEVAAGGGGALGSIDAPDLSKEQMGGIAVVILGIAAVALKD